MASVIHLSKSAGLQLLKESWISEAQWQCSKQKTFAADLFRMRCFWKHLNFVWGHLFEVNLHTSVIIFMCIFHIMNPMITSTPSRIHEKWVPILYANPPISGSDTCWLHFPQVNCLPFHVRQYNKVAFTSGQLSCTSDEATSILISGLPIWPNNYYNYN